MLTFAGTAGCVTCCGWVAAVMAVFFLFAFVAIFLSVELQCGVGQFTGMQSCFDIGITMKKAVLLYYGKDGVRARYTFM